MPSQTLYQEVGGFDAILALCRRWHALCLADPGAAHPFERNLHPNHDERLAAYLAEAWGGPPLYTAGYGDETSIQRLHAGNEIHIELDEACLAQFVLAVSAMGISEEIGKRLNAYFRRATEEMRRFGAKDAMVPENLPFNYANE
jgi:hemoglobin